MKRIALLFLSLVLGCGGNGGGHGGGGAGQGGGGHGGAGQGGGGHDGHGGMGGSSTLSVPQMTSNGASSTAQSSSSAGGAGGGTNCMTCNQFIHGGTDPNQLCSGSKSTYNALESCACSGACKLRCSSDCPSIHLTQSCENCLEDPDPQGCDTEWNACESN